MVAEVNPLAGLIARHMRKGVTLTLKPQPAGPPLVQVIHWVNMGEPNALAAAIMEYVSGQEMSLELDGFKYLIRRVSD